MTVSLATFCIFVSTNHITMATINEGNYKIKELVPGYYTHVEEDEGGDSYSGVYRSSDNQKVIDDYFYVLKEIREGLFYGRNYNSVVNVDGAYPLRKKRFQNFMKDFCF